MAVKEPSSQKINKRKPLVRAVLNITTHPTLHKERFSNPSSFSPLLLRLLPPKKPLHSLPNWLPTRLPHSENVIKENRSKDVEEDKREPNSVIPPAGIIRNRYLSQVLICRRKRTVLAVGGRARVDDLATGGGGVGREILRTCLPGRRLHYGEFVLRADYFPAGDRCGCNCRDQVFWQKLACDRGKGR